MLEIWLSSLRVASRVTPRYFTQEYWEIGKLFREILIFGVGLCILGGIINRLDLAGLTVTLLELNQWDIWVRSRDISGLRIFRSGIEKTKQVSSANNLGLQLTK